MKNYTVGFVFTPDLKQILLIHKLTPEWQNGKVNGIGGKVEPGETIEMCVVREVKEEAGLRSDQEDWNYLGKLIGSDWQVDFFAMVYQGEMGDARSLEEQQVEWFEVANLPANIISNIAWLVPLAVDKLNNREIKTFSVEYN